MRLAYVLVAVVVTLAAYALWADAGTDVPAGTPEQRARMDRLNAVNDSMDRVFEGERAAADAEWRARRASFLLEADGLALTSAEWERGESGNLSVVGTVDNLGAARSYASVTFAVYDASGATVGTVMDNTAHIDDRGTWRFRAPVLDDQAGLTFRATELRGR